MQQRYYVNMSGGESPVSAAEFSQAQLMSDREQKNEIASEMPRERTDLALSASKKLLARLDGKGIFTTSESQQAAKDAQTYEGGEVTPDSSKALKAIVDSLNFVPPETQEASLVDGLKTYVTEFMQVRSPDGTLFPLPKWQEKLAVATPEERALLENEGIYGFVFPKETGEGSPENQLLEKYITKMQADIASLKESNQDASLQEALLAKLQSSSQANGELGILLKAGTLRSLQAANIGRDEDKAEITNTLVAVGDQEHAAQQQLVAHLKGHGMTEDEIQHTKRIITEQGIGAFLHDSSLTAKLQGLDRMFFNADLDDSQLADRISPFLDQRTRSILEEFKKNGGGIGFALLLLLIAPLAVGAVATAEITKNIH